MAKIDFYDQKQFSDFVQRFRLGTTTGTEESELEEALVTMQKDLKDLLVHILEK